MNNVFSPEMLQSVDNELRKHREEMARTKAELAETRKHLKNLTKYVIGHLEALLEKYRPLYPRLTTKSARHDDLAEGRSPLS